MSECLCAYVWTNCWNSEVFRSRSFSSLLKQLWHNWTRIVDNLKCFCQRWFAMTWNAMLHFHRFLIRPCCRSTVRRSNMSRLCFLLPCLTWHCMINGLVGERRRKGSGAFVVFWKNYSNSSLLRFRISLNSSGFQLLDPFLLVILRISSFFLFLDDIGQVSRSCTHISL